jgi:hypothetical protein
MSLLDVEEYEDRAKPTTFDIVRLGFNWSHKTNCVKYCIAPSTVSKYSKDWAILFWCRGMVFKGKKLRSNRLLYRIPKGIKRGVLVCDKKVARNVTTKELEIIMSTVKSAWIDFFSNNGPRVGFNTPRGLKF